MDMSRISTCTYPLREREIADALRVCAEAGFVKADVWGRSPHFSEDQFQCDWPAMKAAAEELGIRVANLGSYPGRFFAAESEHQRHAEMGKMIAAIEGAAYFGARSIRIMPGIGEEAAVIDIIAPYFVEAAKYASERGIYMGMENHKGSIAGDPELAVRLCESVNSPYFGVLYEPCNLMHGGVDYKEALDVFGDWIVHVHIKDGRHENGEFHRTHLGEGDVDFEWVINTLEAAGYRGDYALEYELADIEPCETGMRKWYVTFVERMG